MIKIVVSLTDDCVGINCDRNIFIIQATVVFVLTHIYHNRLKQVKALFLLT